MAGLYADIFTGELVKQFRDEATFLAGIPDFSGRVTGNQTINLVDVGADPAVLINNAAYPIATAGRVDANIAIALDKFDTENTKVTEDELTGLSYDKVSSVIDSHKQALVDVTNKRGLYNIAPAGNTATTPVFATLAATFGRKDILKMKKAFDDQNIPQENRRLVLCNAHIEELLGADEAFAKQYGLDNVNGKVGRIYGFDIYEFTDNPVYQALVKQPYGQAPSGLDRDASIAFYAPRMFQAHGDVEMFDRLAKDDPENRETTIGFRTWSIVLPKKQEAIGAIVTQ